MARAKKSQDILVDNLREVLDWVKSGGDWTSGRMAQFAEEVVIYEFWASVVKAILFGVVFAGGWLILYKYVLTWRKFYQKNEEEFSLDPIRLTDLQGVVLVTAGVVSVIMISLGGFGTIRNSLSAIKASTAPRVLIIDRIERMIEKD